MTAQVRYEGWRPRVALGVALILLAPLATGAATACVWVAMERVSGGSLTYAGFVVPYLCGAVLGAAGSAVAALVLRIRYWLRVASAVGCLFGVFFAFPVFVGPANAVLYALFGVGPEISLY